MSRKCEKFKKNYFRSELRKIIGSANPRVELIEIGPRIDLILKRHKLASESLYKKALKKPRISKVNNKDGVPPPLSQKKV